MKRTRAFSADVIQVPVISGDLSDTPEGLSLFCLSSDLGHPGKFQPDPSAELTGAVFYDPLRNFRRYGSLPQKFPENR
jgi:hypothetical protein